MKTILFMLAVALMFVCSSIMATDTRVTTMGDNNMILLDEANISLFPSRLYDHGNLTVAEFDNNDMMELGVHWKFNKDNPWVLGTYLHNNSRTFHSYSPVIPPLFRNKRLDMFCARKLGEHKFGFHLGMRHSSDLNEKPDDKNEASLSIWTFDVGLTPPGDAIDLSVGLEIMSFSSKGTLQDSSQYDKAKPDGNISFYLQGRKFHKMNAECTVIPHAKLSFGAYERQTWESHTARRVQRPYLATLDNSIKNNTFEFDAGVGLEFTPATNVLAVMDFGFVYDAVERETITHARDSIPATMDPLNPTDTLYPMVRPRSASTSETTFKDLTLPYIKIGFDADIFHWLDVRFGATSFWNRRTVEIDDSKDESNAPSNETYLGFGFHWNRLHIDTEANPALILDGFNFISGESNNMNLRISAVYEMM